MTAPLLLLRPALWPAALPVRFYARGLRETGETMGCSCSVGSLGWGRSPGAACPGARSQTDLGSCQPCD